MAIDVAYLRQYFFLFDDFALVGQASIFPVRELATVAHFGFYRPVVFVLAKAEFWAFSWRHPAGYLAVSLTIHALSAALVFGILRRFGLATLSAAAGAVLFAASPWATEATFWVSGRFDILSGFATLVCVTAMLSTGPRKRLAAAVAVAAAIIALLSKENAVVALPVLVVALVMAADGVRGTWLRWTVIAAIVLAASGYLAARDRVLPHLGGAYGNAGVLFARTPIVANALRYVRAFATVPLPGVPMGPPPGQVATLFIGGAAALMTALAWIRHRRLAPAAIVGFAAAIAPTLWIVPVAFGTQPGRFLYLPGVAVCLLFAAAIDFLSARGRTAQIACATITAAVLGFAIVSVRYQASVWARATSIARDGIDQFRPLVGSGVRDVFISNLPFSFEGGPYVLKDYAFGYYFAGAPNVRAHLMSIDVDGAGSRYLGWIGADGLRDTTFPPPIVAPDRVLTLRLPIAGMPTPAEVRPSHVSVFATPDARRISDVMIAVTALTPWRAEPSDPTLFSVEPSHGAARGSFRIVPLAREAPIDRVETAVVRADEPDGAELATVSVRVRVAPASTGVPPFGSVDVPASPTVPAQTLEPLTFQGWALDDFSLRRVYGQATDAKGTCITLGDATRDGERSDVSRLFPTAHDLYRGSWVLPIDRGRLQPLHAPITVEIYAEDADGLKTLIGVRTIR